MSSFPFPRNCPATLYAKANNLLTDSASSCFSEPSSRRSGSRTRAISTGIVGAWRIWGRGNGREWRWKGGRGRREQQRSWQIAKEHSKYINEEKFNTFLLSDCCLGHAMIFLLFKVITIKLGSLIILLNTFHPIKITRSYSMEIQSTSHHRTTEASHISAPSDSQSHDKTRYSLWASTNNKNSQRKSILTCRILHFPTSPPTTNRQPPSPRRKKRASNLDRQIWAKKLASHARQKTVPAYPSPSKPDRKEGNKKPKSAQSPHLPIRAQFPSPKFCIHK